MLRLLMLIGMAGSCAACEPPLAGRGPATDRLSAGAPEGSRCPTDAERTRFEVSA